MKEYSTESIRNVALVSHSSAGKTMMAETFLHYTGAITRLGKIEDGTTVSDFDDEEKRRTISLYSTVIPVEYKDTKINTVLKLQWYLIHKRNFKRQQKIIQDPLK